MGCIPSKSTKADRPNPKWPEYHPPNAQSQKESIWEKLHLRPKGKGPATGGGGTSGKSEKDITPTTGNVIPLIAEPDTSANCPSNTGEDCQDPNGHHHHHGHHDQPTVGAGLDTTSPATTSDSQTTAAPTKDGHSHSAGATSTGTSHTATRMEVPSPSNHHSGHTVGSGTAGHTSTSHEPGASTYTGSGGDYGSGATFSSGGDFGSSSGGGDYGGGGFSTSW